ncbi:hypothetical protein F4779DRAFT_637384 [Xylariaceae sp. FL0662B]|nr:hypothetical protein F4779DRAFT_637384 [Xylariaceae sp. FL0662B]
MRIETRVIIGKNGSILGKIPVKMDEPSDSGYYGGGVRSPGGNSDLKDVVKGFLRLATRPKKPGEREDWRKVSSDNETFFPNPKITFLVDCPENLVCQICQETPLRMGLSSHEPEAETPAILPCGHLACHNCMSFWLEAHVSCPFCREYMVHIGCRHQVEPRLIAHDTIGSLPKTLPEGGVISNKCHPCRDKDRRGYTISKWNILAEDFKKARREAERFGTAAADLVLRNAQKAFEGVSHGMALDALTARYSSW